MRHYNIISSLALAALTSSANGLQYGYNHVPVEKDPEALASAFPKPKDANLLCPAFQSPDSIPDAFEDGTQGPTNGAEMEYFLRNLSSSNDWMTYRTADFQSEEGRTFPYLFLSTTGNEDEKSQKLRVWLEGAVHGNEPAGDQAVLAFLGKMDADKTWAAELLEKMDIMVLPRYNVDGVFYFQRYLATNFDPNRDHIKLARQQTRDLKKKFTSFSPHVSLDMHEFTANERFGPEEDLVWAADALFSAAKNLNIDEGIRKMSEELFAKKMGEDQEAAGFRWDPYVTAGSSEDDTLLVEEAGTDARIGRNAMGLTQCLTFLCETRGIGIADQHFERRTASALQMILSIIQTAADNAEEVFKTVEKGVKHFVEGQKDIIVTDSSEIIDKKFGMVNATDGSVIQYPVKFVSTTPTTANLTRSRPEAYLIPPAWPDLVARLEVLGLEVETLQEEYSGPVEALNVKSVTLDDSIYEGAVRSEVTTETSKKEMTLPVGSFRVPTNQKNAALAFVALEPENIDSFATFNIIPLEEGDEYPIFRVV